ncbi:MerR family transcriptional regulator [Pendulispora rubella]|uniref:MerR family transcriptional regulator n=1 Tax=Pendulispora rubella TaxID=2741070 RepID=A0ABZ2LDB6_9BACT
MRIGELAKRLGVATSKIRFLEARGLVHSTRRPSQYREYDEGALEHLEFVLQAQSLGFTLDEISRALIEAGGRKRLRCHEMVRRLNAKLEEIDTHIAQTRALRTRVVRMIARLEAR